jgi:hypothetical protein
VSASILERESIRWGLKLRLVVVDGHILSARMRDIASGKTRSWTAKPPKAAA